MNIHCSPGYAPGVPLNAVGFNPGNIICDLTCLDWRPWCRDASGSWCLWPTESSYTPRTEFLSCIFMPWLPIVSCMDALTSYRCYREEQWSFATCPIHLFNFNSLSAKRRLRLPVLPMVPLGPSAPRHPERTPNEVPAVCTRYTQRTLPSSYGCRSAGNNALTD